MIQRTVRNKNIPKEEPVKLIMSIYIKQLQELMEKEGDLEIVSTRSFIPPNAYFDGFQLPQMKYKREKQKRESHNKVWCKYDDKKYSEQQGILICYHQKRCDMKNLNLKNNLI
jgi:hypothetical protein